MVALVWPCQYQSIYNPVQAHKNIARDNAPIMNWAQKMSNNIYT